MASLKFFEIFNQFESVYPDSRARFLQFHNSKALRDILFMTFHPEVRFYRSSPPSTYKPNITDPLGLAPANLYDEMRKVYLFVVGHPQSNGLSDRKRDELLLQFLENLEAKEAQVFINMMGKDLQVPGLDINVVKQAFPTLIR